MNLVKLGTLSAVLVPLATFGYAPAASADTFVSTYFGRTALTERSCYRRAKAALRGQSFTITRDSFSAEDGLALVGGAIGKDTKADVQCVDPQAGILRVFSIHVASNNQALASDRALKILQALLPPGELAAVERSGAKAPGGGVGTSPRVDF